jgi:hypothetical protein
MKKEPVNNETSTHKCFFEIITKLGKAAEERSRSYLLFGFRSYKRYTIRRCLVLWTLADPEKHSPNNTTNAPPTCRMAQSLIHNSFPLLPYPFCLIPCALSLVPRSFIAKPTLQDPTDVCRSYFTPTFFTLHFLLFTFYFSLPPSIMFNNKIGQQQKIS